MDLSVGSFFQFLHRRNTKRFSTVHALPHWYGRAPKAITRDGPDRCILKPVGKALGTHRFWHPVNGIVVNDHLIFDLGHIDKPYWHSFVNERSIRTPTEWIAVLDGAPIEKQTNIL